MTNQANSKRTLCQTCSYPLAQCVCVLTTKLDADITVWILQDRKEARHAKNTARLFSLFYQSTKIILVDQQEAVDELFAHINIDKTVLLFPAKEALPIEELETNQRENIEHVVVLDGTWPKAKKMFFTEPRLETLKTVTFSNAPASKYDIRKSPAPSALATLEAASYFLECVVDLKFSVIRSTFEEILALQWAQQPESHKHRSKG